MRKSEIAFGLVRKRWKLLLCVDAEACDLGEVRCGGEVEYMHVVEDIVSVEPAEKGRDANRRGARHDRLATWVPFRASSEAYIAKALFIHILFGIMMGADRGKGPIEIKEAQFGDVLGAAVLVRHEKIGTYLCRRVQYTPVHRIKFDLGLNCHVYRCMCSH